MHTLGYLDFELLNQDIFDRTLIVDVCNRFLAERITDEAKMYAKAKLGRQQALLAGEPRPTEIGMQSNIYRDLARQAKRSGDVLLESLCLVKGACARDEEKSGNKLGHFSEALVLAFGAEISDVASAVAASRGAAVAPADQTKIPYVAAAVGVANELSQDDLDRGYEVLANVTRCVPGVAYPRIYAIYNRLAKFVYNADTDALKEVMPLIGQVEQLSESWPAENKARSVLTPDMVAFMDNIRRKNREPTKQFLRELSEAIRPDIDRSRLTAFLRRRAESLPSNCFNMFQAKYDRWLQRYQQVVGAQAGGQEGLG